MHPRGAKGLTKKLTNLMFLDRSQIDADFRTSLFTSSPQCNSEGFEMGWVTNMVPTEDRANKSIDISSVITVTW